ncbi:MAG: hypothetical protein O7C63_01165 [Alphaproteobacteria bacterium]|nr:hypothetical protein [Alphaproteobacteria bacterium]
MALSRIVSISTLAAVALVFQFDAAASMGKGQGNNRGKSLQNNGGQGIIPAIQQTINALTNIERNIITDFFQTNYANLPPGLAKRQSLPPGLQRQLERNGTLPPGLTKNRMPSGLAARLPGREDMEILVVGADVILVAAATAIIIDVLFDVF